MKYLVDHVYPGAKQVLPCMLMQLLLYLPVTGIAQVFSQPTDNAAALALGGAVVAYPGQAPGLTNDAVSGFGNGAGVWLGSAIPFGLQGWKAAQIQGFKKLGARDGLGLEAAFSGLETYSEQRYRLLYGRQLAEKVYFGGSAHLLRVSAQEYGNASAVSFSLGVLANPIPGVWLGATVQNPLQQELGGQDLPAVMRIGAAWQPAPAFTVLGEVEKDLDRPSQVKAGIEYLPADILILRIGIRTEPARMGFGAGLRLKNGLELNTAAEWHPVLGLTPAALLAWRI